MKEENEIKNTALEGIRRIVPVLITGLIVVLFSYNTAIAAQLKAGVAKVNITNTEMSRVINDSLYVKALVLDNGTIKAAIISIDAIAIGGIGPIGNDYLLNVRSQIHKDINITPSNVLINASHVHGARVCSDVEQKTIQAVKEAYKNMVPVNIGVGTGYEDRIMENRRFMLKSGVEWDIRHAYPMPPDKEVLGIGKVDPEIGILRLDRKNGNTLAVVYNFACHPYQGVPNKGETADFPGFASKVIEDNLSKGVIALFIQGFGGDISTVLYKDVDNPRDAEPLGNMLGLSTLHALKKIKSTENGYLNVINEFIELPRRTDLVERIDSLEAEKERLLKSLRGMSLNIKTFIPLYIKYNISEDFPSYYSHRYLHDKMTGRNDMELMDAENRRNIEKYLRNIYSMENLTRIEANLHLLREKQVMNEVAGEKPIKVEIQAIRIGEFVMVSFPAEVSVQVGLNIKNFSPFEYTFVAGFTNGYLYYAPTAEQFKGDAQEDADCFLAPEWQKIYEEKVLEILKKI